MGREVTWLKSYVRGYAGDRVVVEQVIHADGVDRTTIEQACNAVGTVANDLGVLMAAVHGGSTPFPVEDGPADHRETG